jgi:hypothetical protein
MLAISITASSLLTKVAAKQANKAEDRWFPYPAVFGFVFYATA